MMEGGAPERSLSALVLGFRFFALAAVAGTASFLHRDGVSSALVAVAVLAAAATAVLQHVVLPRVPRALGASFALAYGVLWTLLVHATGGQGSPLALGYLLELPLSGALFGRLGVVTALVTSVTLYLTYAFTIDAPFHAAAAATLIGFLVLCAGIMWRVVLMLERQRAESEVSQAALTSRADLLAEELQLLGDSLGDALVTIDEYGRVVGINPAGAALLAADPRGSIGKPWQEVLNPDGASRLRLAEMLDSGAPQRGVTMVLSPSLRATLTVRAEMWRGVGGKRIHLLLDPRSDSIVEDPVRRLGESAACVAHQIRNSMHSLQGFVGRLSPPLEVRPGDATPDQCLGALRTLGALADDVLAMAGSTRPQQERVAIQDVLRSALVLLGHPPIRLALPASLVYVDVHRSQLVHAIFNVLDNAIRMNPPGRPVRVSVEQRDDRVVVDITDEGPGVAAEVATATSPVPSRTGAGWGLVAARRFVQECGGRLSLASVDCGGALCRVELPAAPCAALDRSDP